MKPVWLVAVLSTCAVLGLSAYYAPRKSARPAVAVPTAVTVVANKPVTDSSVEHESTDSEAARLGDLVSRVEQGHAWLSAVRDYTATFHKQERVQGTLRELETVDLKLRHVPFSVAMTWAHNGRKAHFQQGANANRMSVLMGGWKARLGWLNLEIDSSLALQEARYPITDVGLMRLSEQLLERVRPYVERPADVKCAWQADEQIGGRPCRVFSVEYNSPEINPDYRRTVVWLDREWETPVSLQSYDWDSSDPENAEGLVEYYVYENLSFDQQLGDHEFTIPRPADSGSEVAKVNPAK